MAELCLVQECAVFNDIAPYIYLVTHDCNARVVSIYRGDRAKELLNRYGKHTQRQLYNASAKQRREWGIEGKPDAPGSSSHELFSDGVAYPLVPYGHRIPWWGQGFDVDADHSRACMMAAQARGWTLFRPYPSGMETHHLNFRHEPHVGGLRQRLTIYKLRHRLPRH